MDGMQRSWLLALDLISVADPSLAPTVLRYVTGSSTVRLTM